VFGKAAHSAFGGKGVTLAVWKVIFSVKDRGINIKTKDFASEGA
jgi:hypothetical protein